MQTKPLLPFKENTDSTIGVELELQLVNLRNYDLAMESKDLLRRLQEISHPGEIVPEITQAMIEINSTVHPCFASLLKELSLMRDVLLRETRQTHIGICGGGTHPFQKWQNQRIYPAERYSQLSKRDGYLANQATVFGQHIHLACQNGDEALYLCHALAPYLPHFIALSSSSPFYQGIDTAFYSARLAAMSAFPLSGYMPWLTRWEQFEAYFTKMQQLGVVKSMKDFYWDIRPKPEFGTVEIRICDTPLTIEKAVDLAAYAHMLSRWLLEERRSLSEDIYLTYRINKFRASRYGFDAELINGMTETSQLLGEDIILTCEQLKPYALALECQTALSNIRAAALNKENGARQLRENYAIVQSLNDVVRIQCDLWKGKSV